MLQTGWIEVCKFILIGMVLLSGNVIATDRPITGLLYNTRETNSLTYSCELESNNSLECEFVQTRIRKKVSDSDLVKSIESAKKYFPTSKELSAEACRDQELVLSALQGKIKHKDGMVQEHLEKLSQIEKRDQESFLEAYAAACKSKKLEDYLNVVKIGHQRDIRTCIVSSNPFKQTFKLIIDPASKARTWVVIGEPSGPCGFVQLSRFEPDAMKDSKLVFWNYIAQRATTNKKGKVFLDASCKDFDESETEFSWKSKDHVLECDYIEFGVF